MRSIIKIEWLKLRRSSLVFVCLSGSLLFTLLAVLKDVVRSESTQQVPQDIWITENMMINNFMVTFFLSTMLLGYLIHREYEERTIKNLWVTGVARSSILFGKLTVWLLLHFTMYLVACAVVYFGYRSIFDVYELGFIDIFGKFMLSAFTAAVVILPLAWVGIKQKQLFYPTILVGILFAVLAVTGITFPDKWPVIVPWSAAFALSSMDLGNTELGIAVLSVAITGILGLILTFVSFQRQEI
ncbi:ABC transporter permease [Enterococcus sp. BWM-S5]|uniref:ABC transporter permease n=1 Tax=Enterococcus larvae TaxID=2794352 RepID=A0ABS4CIY9_9ENTE|nr:ABC transporter permease [Enterococcus larvae]MBP1046148.1 ABC transporter permease [Enterococcus larvae]